MAPLEAQAPLLRVPFSVVQVGRQLRGWEAHKEPERSATLGRASFSQLDSPQIIQDNQTPSSVPNIYRLDYTYVLMLLSNPFTALFYLVFFLFFVWFGLVFGVFCLFVLDYKFSGYFLDRNSVSHFGISFHLQGPVDLQESLTDHSRCPCRTDL